MLSSIYESGIWINQTYFNDGWVRGFLKVCLTVSVLFIAIVGNLCLSLWVKNKLLRGKTVHLNETAGWIYGPSMAKTMFTFRSLPGGWLGWLMILVTVLNPIAEYGVAITVRSELRWTTWVFPFGGIMNAATTTSSPSPYWEAFRWATSAQTYNYYNANLTRGGIPHYGIYRMLTNDTAFMATEDDEIGYWYCTKNMSNAPIYNQAWKKANYPDSAEIYDMDIWSNLYQSGDLYFDGTASNVSLTDTSTGLSVGPSTHTVIVTASDYTVGQLYNISVAIDIAELDDQGSKQMFVFHCSLRVADEARTVESIARVINIQNTLNEWITVIQGALYPGLHSIYAQPVETLQIILEYYFNAMIMVSGVQERIATANMANIPLGLVYYSTRVPTWILVVYAVVFVFAACLAALATYLYIATRAAVLAHDNRNKDGMAVSSKEIMDNTPFGLSDWMAHAAYTSRDADRIPERQDLRNWAISTHWHAGRRLGIVKANEVDVVGTVMTPMTPVGMGYGAPGVHAQPQQTEYFGAKNGTYISLNTREVP